MSAVDNQGVELRGWVESYLSSITKCPYGRVLLTNIIGNGAKFAIKIHREIVMISLPVFPLVLWKSF